MKKRRQTLWLIAVGLVLSACSGDDSSPAGSGGSAASGGTGGAGGSTETGGAGGASGGAGGTAGHGGASGSGGHPEGGGAGGSSSDATSDGPTGEGGEAGTCLPAGTYPVVNQGSSGYLIGGNTLNAPITLCRGNVYTFAIDAPGHPFYVRLDDGNDFNNGVTGNHTTAGNLVFDVPRDAPSMLFYQCDIHDFMTGAIIVMD